MCYLFFEVLALYKYFLWIFPKFQQFCISIRKTVGKAGKVFSLEYRAKNTGSFQLLYSYQENQLTDFTSF